MKTQLRTMFLTCLGLVAIFIFARCTQNNGDKADGDGAAVTDTCRVDSLAVIDKYSHDHYPATFSADKTAINAAAILALFDGDGKKQIGDGEEVPFNRANACLDSFRDLMKDRGFPDNDPPYPSVMGKLTLRETFNGDSLIGWMQRSIDSGATHIELRFGKYYPGFLNWRFPNTADVAEKRKRMGRITIFLYPVKVNADSTSTLVNKAYDLGNLHP